MRVAALDQIKYAAIQEEQTLSHHKLMTQRMISDDLNCGKLTKMINFRVKEILDYIEQMRAEEENKVSDNCQCCYQQVS